jgi:hypothetical protein
MVTFLRTLLLFRGVFFGGDGFFFGGGGGFFGGGAADDLGTHLLSTILQGFSG